MTEKDPWKRKEPNARLSKQALASQHKGETERFEMEHRQKSFVTTFRPGFGFRMSDEDMITSTMLYFRRPIQERDVLRRLHTAFGDLDERSDK